MDRGLLDNFCFCSLGCKIVGTSKNFVKNHRKTVGWDAGESYYSSEHGQERSNIGNVHGFSPSTPLATAVYLKTGSKRKGIPRRAPTVYYVFEPWKQFIEVDSTNPVDVIVQVQTFEIVC